MNKTIEKIKIYGIRKAFLYSISELYGKIWMNFLRKSYSQKGEDLVLDRFLGRKNRGFYVDIGANDPSRFSNTRRFYNRGWSGINIEPDYENYQKLDRQRARDINLNLGIGREEGELAFYKFIPDTLSTFSKDEAEKYREQGYKLIGTIKVKVRPLKDVLREHAREKEIDFMSIDTEGFDMEVLKGSDWNQFQPKLICIESVTHAMDENDIQKKDNHESFLEEIGYKKVFDNNLNSIFLI